MIQSNTQPNDLTQLLQRLTQLEPDRFAKISSNESWYQAQIRGIPFDIDTTISSSSRIGIRSLAYLQMAVQEAIAGRRDWTFLVESSRFGADGSPHYEASVCIPRGSGVFDDAEVFDGDGVHGESAIALGWAYVTALGVDVAIEAEGGAA